MIPGVNAPPMHPWCRSTTVPHVGNWWDKFFKERKGKYQVENKVSEKEKLQGKAKKEMLEMISNGKIKMKLNNEKQERHILNTNAYINKKNNSSYLPSYITIDSNEIEKLTKKEFIDIPVLFDDEGNFRKKQVIDYKKIIGKSYVNGKYIETNLGKVHYSKTGFHVVPYIKKEWLNMKLQSYLGKSVKLTLTNNKVLIGKVIDFDDKVDNFDNYDSIEIDTGSISYDISENKIKTIVLNT